MGRNYSGRVDRTWAVRRGLDLDEGRKKWGQMFGAFIAGFAAASLAWYAVLQFAR